MGSVGFFLSDLTSYMDTITNYKIYDMSEIQSLCYLEFSYYKIAFTQPRFSLWCHASSICEVCCYWTPSQPLQLYYGCLGTQNTFVTFASMLAGLAPGWPSKESRELQRTDSWSVHQQITPQASLAGQVPTVPPPNSFTYTLFFFFSLFYKYDMKAFKSK